MSFTGKVALITGATGGIGLTTAVTLHSLGAKIFATDIAPLTADSPLHALTQETNSSLHYYPADITAPGSPETLVSTALAHFNATQIDILLNIAGTGDNFASAGTIDEALFDKVIAVNLKAPTMLIKAALPGMLAAGKGVIINIASRAGQTGGAAGVAYTASKHGLIGVTKQTAVRYRYQGIRCNAIAPGGVTTKFMQNSGFQDENFQLKGVDMETLAVLMPIQQIGRCQGGDDPAGWAFHPQEVANAIVFLAGDASGMINGTVLPVDAGWSAT